MAGMLTHYDRRDAADRAAVGEAAFALCRAQRAQPGITSSRFFWAGADRIAMLAEAESMTVFDEPPQPELAKAVFDLADVARQTDTERWIDPRSGQEAYQTAGR